MLCPRGQLWVDVEAFEEVAATARREKEPAAYWTAIELYSGDCYPRTATRSGRRVGAQSCGECTSRCSSNWPSATKSAGSTGWPSRRYGKRLPRSLSIEEAHISLMRLYVISGRPEQALGVGWEETARESTNIARRVVAVHGWPGAGKSTFVAALCWDEEILESFLGRVFFLPVGRSPEVRRLSEDLSTMLGVPAPPGASLGALQGRIANALSQSPVLIVLDDVWEERDVAPLLLTGGNSATLVATRRLDVATRLTTVAEGPLRLGLLSGEDSLRLLRFRAPSIVAENNDACEELARALDGLPLALRVTADLLQVEAEAGFDVSGLLTELTEVARILGEHVPADVGAEAEEWRALPTVRALLRKSIERLDQDLVQRFARLGVLPPKPLSFDLWTASDLWRDSSEDPEPEVQTSEEEQGSAREVLGELVRRGLIDSAGRGIDPLAVRLNLRTQRPERFWMHMLIAAFALETLESTEGEGAVREAQQRRLEHYRRVAGAASATLSTGGDTQLLSVFLMAQDLPNIRAAHDWARSHSSRDYRALEYLSRLPSQSYRALVDHLTPEEFLEWTRLAEDAARRIGDDAAISHHRSRLGVALLKNGLEWSDGGSASLLRGDPREGARQRRRGGGGRRARQHFGYLRPEKRLRSCS